MKSIGLKFNSTIIQWSIKEFIVIGLVSIALCVFIRYLLLNIRPDSFLYFDSISEFRLCLSSITLIVVCISWVSVIKKENPKYFGFLKAETKYYFYAILCSILVYLQSNTLLKIFVDIPVSENTNIVYSFWGVLNLILLAPVSEEIYYRGIVFQACKNKFGLIMGAFLSSLIFGFVHFDQNYLYVWWILTGFPAILGFILCIIYTYSKSIFPAILGHITYNIISYCINVQNLGRG